MCVALHPHMMLGGYINVGWCALIHSRPHVLRLVGCVSVLFFLMMDEAKFKLLMDEIRQSRDEARQSRQELEQKLSNLQSEVTAAEEKTSQELAHRISKSSHQFQRKGHKMQFNFNSGVQESIAAARSELVKMTPEGKREKETLKKVTAFLDEGAKSLATRQKHIQLADRSEYGWATVKFYEADPWLPTRRMRKVLRKQRRKPRGK